jgi:hypothetical protein
MDNQQENSPKPVQHPEEANTGEQPEVNPESENKEKKSTQDPPHVETPKVPDADTEGLP